MTRAASRLVSAAVVAAIAGHAGSALGQQVNARWLTATSANWNTAARWSTNPNAPNNGTPSGRTYRVVFDATGVSYTASVTSTVTIDELVMNSAPGNVVLSTGADFSVLGNITLTAGSLQLQGGRLRGGTVVAAGGSLVFGNNAGNILDAVTFSGAHSVTGNFSRARVVNGLNFTGGSTLRMAGGASQLNFEGAQSITGGTLHLDSSSTAATIEGAGVLTIAPGATVRGQGTLGSQLVATNTHSLVNNGDIAATTAGGTLTVRPATFTNNGISRADAGATLTINAANWTNNGSITTTGGTVNLRGSWGGAGTISATDGTIDLGGTFTTDAVANLTRTNSTVRITGVADNTGRTLAFNSANPGWTCNQGRIVGGTVSFADHEKLILDAAVTFDGVQLVGDTELSSPFGGGFTSLGAFQVNDSLKLTNLTSMTFSGPTTINGDLHLSTAQQNQVHVDDTFTVAAGGVVEVAPTAAQAHTSFLGSGSIVNHGTISISNPSSTLWIRPANLSNTGLIERTDGGLLRIGEPGNTTFSNSGTVRVAGAGGRLILGGFLSTPNLGTLEVANDATYLTGALDNTDATLTLDSSTGSWRASNGRILGGTVNCLDGKSILFNDASVSTDAALFLEHGVTFNGDLNLGNVSGRTNRLIINDGFTLNGTLSVTQPDARIDANRGGIFEGGVYAFDAPSGFNAFSLRDGQTMTISPTTVFRGGRAAIGNSDGIDTDECTVINYGRITADVDGANFGVSAQHFENHGVLEAINGGILGVGAGNGGEAILNGVVRIRGASTFGLGNRVRLGPDFTWDRVGGTVLITDTFLNSGSVLDINAASGDIGFGTVSPTAIDGGTIRLRDGAKLYGNGRLYGVTIDGTLPVNGNNLIFENGVTLNGQIRLAANNGSSSISFAGGPATPNVLTGGTVTFEGNASTNQEIRIGASTTAVLDEDVVVRGGGGQSGSRFRAFIGGVNADMNTTLVNYGLISSDRDGMTLLLAADSLVNHGTLEARDGGILRMRNALTASWSNTGIIRVLPGSQLWLANRVTTEGLGTIQNDGGTVRATLLDIENSDDVLTFDDTTGTWKFSQSSIKGGTVNCTDGQSILLGGSLTLDGLTLNGDVSVPEFGSRLLLVNDISINGTVHLSGPGTHVNFVGESRLLAGTVLFDGVGAERTLALGGSPSALLTLSADTAVRGGNGAVRTTAESSILNQGLISADVDSQKIRIFTQRFTNEGTIEAVNGGIIEFVPPPGLNPTLSLFNAGTIRLAPGALFEVPGDLAQARTATLAFDLTSDTGEPAYGLLAIDGTLTLGGELRISFADGFRPDIGTELRLVRAASFEGDFSGFRVRPLGYGRSWDLSSIATNGTIRVVPSAGPLGMLASAAACVALRRRRSIAPSAGGVR